MQQRFMIALLLGSALFSAGPAQGEKTEPRRDYPPEKVETVIWAMTQDHLSSVRDMKKQQVENYFANLLEQARLLAADAGMVKILKDLRLAFPEYQTQTLARIEQCCSPREELQAFYAEVVKEEQYHRSGNMLPLLEFPEALDDNALVLQYRYLAANPNPPWLKKEYPGPEDEAAYSQLHRRYHPDLRALAARLGFSDLMLLDNQGRVLYSVAKNPDFATSLSTGPHANSNLGTLVGKLQKAPTRQPILEDFGFYSGAYGAWRAFVGVPMESDGLRLGMLILSINDQALNALVSDHFHWPRKTFGQMGQTVLINHDTRMRNQDRLQARNPARFFEQVVPRLELSPEALETMRHLNISAGFMKYNLPATRAALSGVTGFDFFLDDETGQGMLLAYAPLDIPGLDWVILNQLPEAELPLLSEDLAPEPEPATPPAPVTLRFGFHADVAATPWLLAEKSGEFAKHGKEFRVEFQVYPEPSPAKALAGYREGRFDAVMVGAASVAEVALTAERPGDVILFPAKDNGRTWSARDDSAEARYLKWRYLLRVGAEDRCGPRPPAEFDSGDIPGEIRDALLMDRDFLQAHPNAAQALLAGWFGVMEKLRDNRRKATLDELAKLSGLSLENYSREIADIEWTEYPNRALRPLVRVNELRDWLRTYRLLAARYGEETDILDEARVAYYPGAENSQPLRFNPAPLYGLLSQ